MYLLHRTYYMLLSPGLQAWMDGLQGAIHRTKVKGFEPGLIYVKGLTGT